MRPASKEQHAKTTRTFCDSQRHVVRAALLTPVEIICTCLLPICRSKEMLFASFWNASELQWTSLALMRRLLLKIRQLLPPQIPCARMAERIATRIHYPPDQKTLKSNVSCACDANRQGNEYAPCRRGCVHENIA